MSPDGTSISYFLNSWTLIVATSVVSGIVKVEELYLQFSGTGKYSESGIICGKKTFDAVPRR
jgi:hypothetical protein